MKVSVASQKARIKLHRYLKELRNQNKEHLLNLSNTVGIIPGSLGNCVCKLRTKKSRNIVKVLLERYE